MPMLIGVPKEIKTKEFRVGLTPAGCATLTQAGHSVLIEASAGEGSGLDDAAYRAAGAEIVASADEVWKRAEMVVKVKEPIAPEFPRMRKGQLLFTYLHLAAAHELGHQLIEIGVDSVAYETIETDDRRLPLLTPMSAVAGRMSVQAGAAHLEKEKGGKGVLLGGVPGVRRGRVAIIGGGVVGSNAARMAVGLGADVTVLDVNADTLAYLDDIYQGRINTRYSDPMSVAEAVAKADLVVGAVLVAGARAPRLVTAEMIRADGAWLGRRRRRGRPGRLRRKLQADHPRRADLRNRRRHPLLRRQHARSGPADFDLRPHQRHPALRPHARGKGSRGRREKQSRHRPRHQYLPRGRPASGRCRGIECQSHAFSGLDRRSNRLKSLDPVGSATTSE